MKKRINKGNTQSTGSELAFSRKTAEPETQRVDPESSTDGEQEDQSSQLPTTNEVIASPEQRESRASVGYGEMI